MAIHIRDMIRQETVHTQRYSLRSTVGENTSWFLALCSVLALLVYDMQPADRVVTTTLHHIVV